MEEYSMSRSRLLRPDPQTAMGRQTNLLGLGRVRRTSSKARKDFFLVIPLPLPLSLSHGVRVVVGGLSNVVHKQADAEQRQLQTEPWTGRKHRVGPATNVRWS
jgi:hypothetical protein